MTETDATAPATSEPVAVGGLESAAPPRRDNAVRFPGFDGLRAIAAATVVITHTSFISGTNVRSHTFGPYLARLDSGVSIFFLISGFLLYRPFAAAHLQGRAPMRTGSFLQRRFLRIFPAYWLALSASIFVFHKVTLHSPGEYLIIYGLLQIYFPAHVRGGITQAWSLCTEISFYLFLPVYARIVRRGADHRDVGRRYRRELAGVAALFVAGYAFRVVFVTTHLFNRELAADWLPAYFDMFALGMLLAVLSAWAAERRTAGEGAFSRPGAGTVSWALAFVCLWLASHHVGLPLLIRELTLRESLERQLLYEGMAFFLLLPAVFGPQDRGLIRRFLKSRPMWAIGLISYGIYLWHELWIDRYYLCQPWLAAHADCEGVKPFAPPGHFWDLTIVVVVLSVAASVFSYWVVEKPSLKLKTSRR
jgi:peptidoglycan/LPS O-acetylase OafA/YrhL